MKNVHAFCDDALAKMDAVAIAEAIKQKKISAEEAITAAIKRAEKVNPKLNAIVYEAFDEALQNAKHVKSNLLGGVPTFIKDNEHVKGQPTQFGVKAFQSKLAKRNSRFINQYLSTGMISLGKSSLPEFGLICSTENPKWGITRNPWDTDYTTGGSSSGSAAMVASGVVPIALANDGAGSTRIPAACCGLVGLKPSRNRLINFEGSNLLPLNIGYEGVVTRSVRDTIAFHEAAEDFYKSKHLLPIGKNLLPTKQKLRIAYFENSDSNKMGFIDDETFNALEKAASHLKAEGHQMHLLPFQYDVELLSQHFLNYYGLLAFVLRDLSAVTLKSKIKHADLDTFTNGLSTLFRKNFLSLRKSLKVLRQTADHFTKLFEHYDLIMMPVLSHLTPPIGFFDPQLPFKEISQKAIHFAAYTGLQNITGLPAISLPLASSKSGMPIGIQFVAPAQQDRFLLEVSLYLEREFPFKNIYD